MDTTNILFICGGAFVGLDNIIEQRIGKKSMGFKAEVKSKAQKNVQEILEQVQPGDLIKYGLIPEFVGRLPVIGVLGDLDQDALVKILTEPRNALSKQYQKIFEYENVTLTFTRDALEAIAQQSLLRKIGARGLRLILEDLMLDLMYQLPSRSDITECVITKEVVENKTAPIILMEKAG
jgi:ATP-dependent Clp protease ATP-binding subunit ClpX